MKSFPFILTMAALFAVLAICSGCCFTKACRDKRAHEWAQAKEAP